MAPMGVPLLWGLLAPEWVTIWLTPVWLIAGGVLAGICALVVLAMVAMAVFPRARAEIRIALSEGVLFPITIVVLTLSAFAFAGPLFVRNPQEKLASLTRLSSAGTREKKFTLKPAKRDVNNEVLENQEEAIPLENVRREELVMLRMTSDQSVILSPKPDSEKSRLIWELAPDETTIWAQMRQVDDPFPDGDTIDQLYGLNLSAEESQVTLSMQIHPPDPEVAIIPYTALFVCIFYLLYFVQRTFAPRLSAVALTTFKSEVNGPLFILLTALGAFFLTLFILIPYNTFGEDIKMLKDTGLTLILVLTIFQAIWAASTSVSEEIEGRTALTVLSKPIDRRTFLIGKFLGITWTVALMFVVLGVVLLVVVAYKPIYDARETSDQTPTWQICYFEMIRTAPGLALMFMQTIVLAALSVALSTRMPLAPNFIICFAIYVLGHLTPLLVQTSEKQFEVVKFFAHLMATVVPVLENFDVAPAIASAANVPNVYLGYSLLYCFLYTLIAMLLALLMFEDRDLA